MKYMFLFWNNIVLALDDMYVLGNDMFLFQNAMASLPTVKCLTNAVPLLGGVRT